MNNKKILITGITGQDGSYLSDYLIKNGYEVFGTTRKITKNNLKNLNKIGVKNSCKIFKINNNYDYIDIINNIKPDQIYHLAAQSSVAQSFIDPVNCYKSIIESSYIILEVIKKIKKEIRFFNSCSSECFGNIKKGAANEKTIFNPISPYGFAKSTAYSLTKFYRDKFDLFAMSGLMFNHESPLRKNNYVTQKIIEEVKLIALKKKNTLSLGNLNIKRDWGWAPDYVIAMYKINNNNLPKDYIVSSGKINSLKKFIQHVFEYYNLNYKDHIKINKNFFRKNDIERSLGNPSKIKKELNWYSTKNLKEISINMIEYNLK